jgi:hypothetical protein
MKDTNSGAGQEYWWLAVNGSSVAACFLPAPRTIRARPTPEHLIGFPTREEQQAAQRFLRQAPPDEAARFMTEQLLPRVRSGELAYIRPENPQPPLKGPTAWEVAEG